MHYNALLIQARLDRLAAIEDLTDFLERPAPRLHEEEVDEDEFEYVPEDEEEVVLFRRVSVCSKDSKPRGVGLTFQPAPEKAMPVTKVL